LSERRACRLARQPRGTQRYRPTQRDDEDRLTQAILALPSEYGRYGHRRITALLQQSGWCVGEGRVQRIWRREGLKCERNRSRAEDCGLMMEAASGCGRNVAIMRGATILSTRARMTDAAYGCW
jgi:hypothetical protein